MIFKGRNRVTSGYKLAGRKNHNGIDIVGDDNTDILSTVEGTVVQSRIVDKGSDRTWEWGNYVAVRDAKGNTHYFCHMASRAVKVGDKVKVGTKLGVMGNTGYSFGAHTHYEVRNSSNQPINPAPFAGVSNAVGTYTTSNPTVPTQPEDDDMTKYRVYDIVMAKESREDAINAFIPLKESAPNEFILTNAGGDGKWRIGKVVMATESLNAAIENMTADRFLA